MCIGAGMDLISYGDIVVCDETASFSIREVKIGMCPDLGTLQRLSVLVGNVSILNELSMSGRFFNAEEAYQLGLTLKPFLEAEMNEKVL